MATPKKKSPKSRDAGMTTRGLRMTHAYAKWLEELADTERLGIATLVDRVLAAYAKEVGFREPPKRVR
jgi:hypothetical protein